eukprot:g12238.t2
MNRRRIKRVEPTLLPRTARETCASIPNYWPRRVPVACCGASAVKAVGLLVLVIAPLWCPAAASLQPHTLKVKTCNNTHAGTVDHLFLSFCDGESSCETGPPNLYNAREELGVVGAWNTLQVPLEYEPTTMLMTILGTDAWCVEEVVWNGGANLLGRGSKLYLDGNLGERGCEYGVNINEGWFYPCQSSWRLFNLPGSDDYKYDVEVKACSESSTAPSEWAQLPSTQSAPEILGSLCSESQCNGTVGEVVDFNLTETSTSGDSGWASTLVAAGFNPVAMRLVNVGNVPWCAEQIYFNDYTLMSRNVSPQGLQLAVSDHRNFFNVQAFGPAVRSTDDNLAWGEPGYAWDEEQLWNQTILAVLVFAMTSVLSLSAKYSLRRCASFSRKNERSDGVGEDREGGGHNEAADAPLCKACHQVGHYPPRKGTPKDPPRHVPVAGAPNRVLLRDDSGRMLFSNDGDQPQSDCRETRSTAHRLWRMGTRRFPWRMGLGLDNGATSGTAGNKSGFVDRAPVGDDSSSGSGVSSYKQQLPDGSAKTDNTATFVATITNNNGRSISSAPRSVPARELSAETFVEGFNPVRDDNTASCDPQHLHTSFLRTTSGSGNLAALAMWPRLGSLAGKLALLLWGLTAVVILAKEEQESAHRDPNLGETPRPQAGPLRGNHLREANGEDGGGGIDSEIEEQTTLVPVALCPYEIDSEEEAILRMENTSLPGNVVRVKNMRWCRLGNHFTTLFRNMALGFCCKSKVLWLPPKDDILAPGIFNEGTPGPRWFDFSSAPGMPGFDSTSCPTDITWGGRSAYHMDEHTQGHELRTPGLKRCIKRAPRLLGCEAAYFFPKDLEVCPTAAASPTRPSAHQREEKKQNSGGKHDFLTRSELAEATPSNEEEGRQVELEWGRSEGGGGGGGGGRGAGTLVLHVRSGDVFIDAPLSSYGQPPLQFYLQAIHHAKWDRVDVVTNGQEKGGLSPVIHALEAMSSAGELPTTINFHTNRSMEEDLRSMICADGLGLAISTLADFVGFHSRSKRIFGPRECNYRLNRIALFRPEAQVYGVVWPRFWLGRYSVYKRRTGARADVFH